MAFDQGSTAAVEEQVTTFLRQNLPQIEMHGGDASVLDLDPASGRVRIRLTGACSGCGISPMTVQAIKSRLPEEVAGIEEVVAETGTPDEELERARQTQARSQVDTVGTESAGAGSDGHDHGMGGHPAGGGVSLDYEGEIPDWRKE